MSKVKKAAIYLDYNATTPVDKSVISAIKDALDKYWGNPSSGYKTGQDAKRQLEDARLKVASMIHASPNEVTFTSGGTEVSIVNIGSVGLKAKVATPIRNRSG